MRITDHLPWRDRLLALIVIAVIVGGLWLLTSCAPEPPQPEPLPTQIAQAEPTVEHHAIFAAMAWQWPGNGQARSVTV